MSSEVSNEPPRPAARERDIELATGLRYHIREWGEPGDGDVTTILGHGFLDSSATFAPLARTRLADGRHLVAPDMRGHGDSDRVGAGGYYHFADYIADMAALLEHFDSRRVALVGHAMGGSICAYVAGASRTSSRCARAWARPRSPATRRDE